MFMEKQMIFWKDKWDLGEQMRDMIVCDVCLGSVNFRLQKETRVAPRRGFMTVEFFWEALLLGR